MILLLGFVIAVAVALVLPFAALEPFARVLIPGIALMAAGIFPSMSLVVGAMRGDERTPALVKELHGQLREILRVLAVSFILALLSILAILASVGVGYTDQIPHIVIVRRVIMCLAAVLIVLLSGRIAAVVKAFFAVLEINKKQALLVARASNRKFFDEARQSAALPPDTYASNVKRLKKVE